MKKFKYVIAPVVAITVALFISSFTSNTNETKEGPLCNSPVVVQKVNLFVTHGHCSTPFSGNIENLVILRDEEVEGNPLENMQVSFDINPHSFRTCWNDEYTPRVQQQGLFQEKAEDRMTFKSTSVYTMGIDWYQVNGVLSIKGVEKEMKFLVSGIRGENEHMASHLVFEGVIDLLDWGIDYDKIVTGKSDPHPTKWMHINMKVDLANC